VSPRNWQVSSAATLLNILDDNFLELKRGLQVDGMRPYEDLHQPGRLTVLLCATVHVFRVACGSGNVIRSPILHPVARVSALARLSARCDGP
jgi:hypothetical protein